MLITMMVILKCNLCHLMGSSHLEKCAHAGVKSQIRKKNKEMIFWVTKIGQKILVLVFYFPVYFCDLNETLAV